MMFNLKGRNRNCEHPKTTTTANYGLSRTVCRDCGVVHIEDMGTSVTETLAVGLVEELEIVEKTNDQSLATAG